MMRALCTICTELFDETCNVSATSCGHTFHNDCLLRWLKTKLTCPQCRTRVTSWLPKIYFSQPDGIPDGGTEPQLNELVNQLETAKLSLQQKDAALSRMLAKKLQSDRKVRYLNRLYENELAKNRPLKEQLADYEDVQRQASLAKQEAQELRKKLAPLQCVEKLIEGSEREVKNMITKCNSFSQLATWCCIYKRKLDQKKAEIRDLQKSNRKLKMELKTSKSLLSERNLEHANWKEIAKSLGDDLSSQDQQMKSMRKKIDALQVATASHSSTTSSSSCQLINGIPARFV